MPPAPDLQQAALDSAIATVQQLYSDLSNGNGEAARQLLGGGAADQFDLAFFSQFQRVGVSDLREIGRSGLHASLFSLGSSHTYDRMDFADAVALLRGPADERGVAFVQRAHRRHKADGEILLAPSVAQAAQRGGSPGDDHLP